ncbi:MAG: response regulator transcription factor, partial [Thermoplasmatota archaeon]
GWLADLADRLYQLDCAVEDIGTALAEGASHAELVAVCRNLTETTTTLRPALRRHGMSILRLSGGRDVAAHLNEADVVLLDLRLPDMLASEAVKLLRMAAPRAKIVIFTAYAGHKALKAAMEAGVDGCLLKDAADTDLVEAIRRVARGESVYDARLERDSMPGRAPKMPGPELTRREYEVLRRVAARMGWQPRPSPRPVDRSAAVL